MSLFSSLSHLYSSWADSRALEKLDADRLNDLGLNAFDIYESRRLFGQNRAAFLDARRTERAFSWLR
ncbi:MAG: hypothetical protein KDJ19_09120 [Hyphomicrobiaceae bacterium]|nr:hypothetical protein [Hyphomicrobiaceae bacterium]MCC0023018.1 hypothetical protein [Hyphomicrobiaceae bacterium]